MLKDFSKRVSAWLIFRSIKKEWTILDVGCGYNSPLKQTKKGKWRVGIDFYKPYLQKSKKNKIHDDYLEGDIRILELKEKSFDCVLAIELIEHFNKGEAKQIIEKMEKIANKKIILTTPNGFWPTQPGENDNPAEKHLCGWQSRELKAMGFRVYGLGGLKNLWTIEKGKCLLRKPQIFSLFLAGLTQPFVYFAPQKAARLLAVKDL